MKDPQTHQLEQQACELARTEQWQASKTQGEQALAMADQWAVQTSGLTRQIVSYSLFGGNPCYCETAIANARHMRSVYAGWEMWVFHDDSVPTHVLARLAENGVKLQHVQAWGIAHWPGTFWRFAAVHAPQALKVIFRDADSLISPREQALVAQWLESGKPFHTIRDWYTHVELMLAGLWGAHAPLLGDMRRWIEDFLATEKIHPTHADQEFLAQYVWPRIRDYTLIHDSIHEGPHFVPFAPAEFSPEGKNALGGYKMKRYDFSFERDGAYILSIVDQQNQVICSYERQSIQGQDAVELPYEYCDRLSAGSWRFDIRFVNG